MSIKGINLKNKTVVLSAEHYKGDEAARTFVCQEGFGCNPVTHGTAIVGYFVNDGEHCRIERPHVEKVVADYPVCPICHETIAPNQEMSSDDKKRQCHPVCLTGQPGYMQEEDDDEDRDSV